MIHLNRQQTKILQILKQTGKNGMNSYTWRPQFIQLPVRIKELKEKGFLITTRDNDNRSVDYILIGEPSREVVLFGEKSKFLQKKGKKERFVIFNNETNTAREVAFEEYQKHNQPVQEVLL